MTGYISAYAAAHDAALGYARALFAGICVVLIAAGIATAAYDYWRPRT